MNDWFIKVVAVLDKVKSAKNLREALLTMKGLFVTVEGRLNKSQTRKNLKSDLDKMNMSASVEGKLDKSKTKKGLKSDLNKIEDLKVDVIGDLNTSKTKKKLKSVIKDLSIDVKMNLGTPNTESVSQGFDKAAESSVGLFSKLRVGVEVLNALKNAAREAVQTIKELDKKKIDIQMVTGSSTEDVDRLMNSYNRMAQQMGATTAQVADGASTWLRQGKSIEDTNELLRQSMILSKVGGMDSATATDRLTSALNGYKKSAKEASDIVNKLAAVDLSAAVSSDEVSEALSRTASSASLAGVELDKIIGMITVVQETTRKSASTIGESFKSIFARMGKVKLGFLTDDQGEDISNVETTLKSLGIQLRESNQEFRNFDTVLDDIGDRWESFSSVQQRAVASAFAGVYQSENFLSLMNNYGKALEYAEISANSAGIAMQKFGVYQDGLEAKTNRFIAAFESLSVNTLDSGLIKGLVDTGTVLITVVDKLGLVQSGLLGLAAAGTLKGLIAIKVSAIEVSKSFAKMNEAMSLVKTINPNSDNALNKLGEATKGLSDAQLKLVLSSDRLSEKNLKTILTAQGLSKEQAQAKLQTLGLASAQGVATATTATLKGAFQTLWATISANPIGAAITALTIFASVISFTQQKAEEARQAMKDATDAAHQQSQELNGLIAQYTGLAQSQTKDENTRKQLLSVQESIVKMLGSEKAGLDLVNGSYGEQIKILGELTEHRRKEIEQTLKASQVQAHNESNDAFLFGGLKGGFALDYKENPFKEASDELKMLAEAEIKNLQISFDGFGRGVGASVIGSPEEQVEAWTDAIDELSGKGKENTSIYKELVAIRDKYRGVLNAEYEATQALNEHLAQTNIISLQQQQGMPQTIVDYINFKNAAIDSAGANESLAAIIGTMVNSMFPQFTEDVASINDGFQNTLYSSSELANVLNTTASAVSDLSSAYEEQEKNGQISIDTLSKLMSSHQNWMELVTIENGVISLNGDAAQHAAKAIIQAEIDKLEATKINAKARIQELGKEVSQYKMLITLARHYGEFGEIDKLKDKKSEYDDMLKQYSATDEAIKALQAIVNSENPFTNLANGASKAAEATQKLNAALEQSLKSEGDAAIRVIDKKIKSIQDAQKASEKAIDSEIKDTTEEKEAFTEAIDEKIEQTQKEKDSFKETVDANIEAIRKEREEYQKAIDAELDKLNERKQALEESIKDYESAAGAVNDLIGEQMDAIDKQKDEVNEFYDEQLEALDKTNKALQDQI